MHGRHTGADHDLGNSDLEVLYVGESGCVSGGEAEAGPYIT
jgi:hypothetical protein